LFGSHKFNADPTTVYSVYNENTYTNLIGSANLNVTDPGNPSLHNRDTVATINGLVPDSNGILYVRFIGSNGAEGYLNAMQLVGVPEPTTLCLLAGGVVLVLGFRRR
jgi:hypothetical protein